MVGKPLAEVKIIFVERLPIINTVKIDIQQNFRNYHTQNPHPERRKPSGRHQCIGNGDRPTCL